MTCEVELIEREKRADVRVPHVRERERKREQGQNGGVWPAATTNGCKGDGGDGQNRFLRRRGILGRQRLSKDGSKMAAAVATEGSSQARGGDGRARAPDGKEREHEVSGGIGIT